MRVDDLELGQAFELGWHTVTEREILEFGRKWDPQPFHADVGQAERTWFGGLVASGIQTIAIFQKLMVEAVYADMRVLAGRGLRNGELLRPVRPDTTLIGRATVAEIDLRDDGRATVIFAGELHEDTGELVARMSVDVLFERG